MVPVTSQLGSKGIATKIAIISLPSCKICQFRKDLWHGRLEDFGTTPRPFRQALRPQGMIVTSRRTKTNKPCELAEPAVSLCRCRNV
jgi:hypothetical protein